MRVKYHWASREGPWQKIRPHPWHLFWGSGSAKWIHPLAAGFRHGALSSFILFSLLSLRPGPYLSRWRSSTWFVSKREACQSQIHTVQGLFTLLASPRRRNFAGLVGRSGWFGAFSVKQMKPFWMIPQTPRPARCPLFPAHTEAALLLRSLRTLLSDISAFHLRPSKPTWTASTFPGRFRKKTIRSKPTTESEATFPITHIDKLVLRLLKPH